MGADDSGVEIAILGFAALAAAVIGSLWLGATVACLVAGHGGLGVGLVGAARAVPGLAQPPRLARPGVGAAGVGSPARGGVVLGVHRPDPGRGARRGPVGWAR